MLPCKGIHQLVNDDGKSNGRGTLSEFLHQMVVASAFYNSVSGAEGVSSEYDPGIVSIGTAHTEVKSDIFLYSVRF